MRHLLLASVAAASIGCGAPTVTPQPDVAGWTPPPDWVIVSNVEGSLQLTLPPYIRVGDNHGAIFANVAPPPGTSEIPIQLWAEGPSIDGAPNVGGDLRGWVDGRIDSPVKGIPAVTPLTLPAGTGIRYDRIDAAGTPNAWRIVVFAIRTPRGAGWLMIDGPPEEWAARAVDLERIPLLFAVR